MRGVDDHVMRRLVALVAMAGAGGCHHTPARSSSFTAPCFMPYPPPPAGTIRIDGPGAFGWHAGDSLIVRVDNKERWSGILQACSSESPGLSFDVSSWQAAGDTVEAI